MDCLEQIKVGRSRRNCSSKWAGYISLFVEKFYIKVKIKSQKKEGLFTRDYFSKKDVV